MLITVHKCVYGNAPIDLKEMIHLSKSNRTRKLEVKDSIGVMGDRAFSVCGPRLWNALPTNMRMVEDLEDFKGRLKTYLFKNGDIFYETVHIK